MKIKSMFFLVFLLIGTFAGCENKEKITEDVAISTQSTQASTQSHKAPVFNLTTSNGKIIKITAKEKGWEFKGLEGKIILLDFFGTWCPPCKAEIPHLNNIRSKISSQFEIIGIDIGKRGTGEANSKEYLAEFISNFKIKYPITSGLENNKLYHAIKELNPNGSIPFMVLFNAKGQYITHYIGMVPEEMIQSDINKFLKQK